MVRILVLAVAALVLVGAKRPPSADYRLGIEASDEGPPLLSVEIRLRGDEDGETRFDWPAGLAEPSVSGARVEAPDGAHRVLRHRPGRKLTVRYRVRAAARPQGAAALGEAVFATPEGRLGEAATFRWSRRPRGWSRRPRGWEAVSDLEHGDDGRALTVDDVRRSVILAGPELQVVEQPLAGGVVRAAALGDAPRAREAAEAAAPIVAAHRAYWGGEGGPFLIAVDAADRPTERGDALALPPVAGSELRDAIAAGVARSWVPGRTARADPAAPPPPWIEGLADFVAVRVGLRAGRLTPDSAVGRIAAFDRPQDPAARGAMLALKWDEDIRRKSGGKADLDDVLLRMREHHRRFPAGQGPDAVTGLVSAAWVTAQLDLRPDIARYADRGEEVPLPEQLFDGCLDARVNVSPGFDSGFDHKASAAAKVVRGVRRGGPAWNSGLRNGMRLDSLDLREGDMTREIVVTVRPARGRNPRVRTIRYWPYGDDDVETREIALAFGLSGDALAACGRKIGGL